MRLWGSELWANFTAPEYLESGGDPWTCIISITFQQDLDYISLCRGPVYRAFHWNLNGICPKEHRTDVVHGNWFRLSTAPDKTDSSEGTAGVQRLLRNVSEISRDLLRNHDGSSARGQLRLQRTWSRGTVTWMGAVGRLLLRNLMTFFC